MHRDDERRSFPARTDVWPEVRGFVESRASSLGLARGVALRLELIAEELFINSAEHGHNGDGQPVLVELRDAGKEVEFCIEDRAAEFNPLVAVPVPANTSDPDKRPVGRLGRTLVVGLSSRCNYLRTDTGNRVTVAVLKNAGAALHNSK